MILEWEYIYNIEEFHFFQITTCKGKLPSILIIEVVLHYASMES